MIPFLILCGILVLFFLVMWLAVNVAAWIGTHKDGILKFVAITSGILAIAFACTIWVPGVPKEFREATLKIVEPIMRQVGA